MPVLEMHKWADDWPVTFVTLSQGYQAPTIGKQVRVFSRADQLGSAKLIVEEF